MKVFTSRRKTETEEWLQDEFSASPIDIPKSAGEYHPVVNFFSPFMNPYFCSIDPIFALQAPPAVLARRKKWLLRDGAVSLAWFFQNASPKLIRSHLIIHSDLFSIVPDNWLKQISTYQVVSNINYDAFNLPKKILLTGPINEEICSIYEMKIQLEQLVAEIGINNLKKIRTQIYCPVRKSPNHMLNENFEAQAFHLILHTLGENIEFIDREKLENTNDFQETLLVELNGGWIYKDSALQHLVLSKGAGLLKKKRSDQKKLEVINCSPYHRIEIYRPHIKKNRLLPSLSIFKFYQQLNRSENQNDQRQFPWPREFYQWIHSFFYQCNE